jgi:thiol-disulfide isomerase/thioredoxin
VSAAPPPSGRRGWLIAGGIAAVAAGLGAVAGWQRLAPGEPADDAVPLLLGQTFPDAAGQPLALERFAGRPLIVNFWATWCAPCVEEMPELSALHAELSPKGLGMVGIGIDSPSKIAEFAARSPVTYPLVVAGMGGTELSRRLGNGTGALPFTVVVDRRARVVQRVLGRVDIARLKAVAVQVVG